ncbi:MAG TPA: DUF6157 family protein, partial [Kofleriaceae bacterium]|nr:DUF6157 family protein [Kofleriaceae bacterium]
AAAVPSPRGGKPTIATLQHALLSTRPGALTQPDVLFETWLARQALPARPTPAELARLRAALFAKPQACLRASPLPKQYGFGLLFDRAGKITLCPMESAAYRDIVAGKRRGITILKALRSKR